MIRNAIRMSMLAAAFTFALPGWADYETGQRAWDAGHPDEALTQWRAAADAGDRRAMLALGQRYLQGLGVLQDYVEAHMWFNLAASRGEVAALGKRDAVAAKMTPAQIAAAQQRAAAWRLGASAGGSAPASAAPSAGVSASEEDSPPPRAIREAQTLLAALGYRPGPADGVWGRRTAGAYRAFLRDAGLPAAKALTPDALRAMRAVARRGDAVPDTLDETAAAADSVQASSAESAPRPTPVRPEALHRAARAGDIDGLRAAIAAGVDVNARDGRGWTALMHVVNKGYTLLVPLLLEAEAEADVRAPDGATALFMAAVHGHAEIFAQLMQAGADASIPGPQGRTPLEVVKLKEGSRILALPEVVALLEAEKERRAREEARLRAQADSEAFSRAKSLHTRQAYRDYVSAWCPGGSFCETARSRHGEVIRESIAGKTFSGPTPYAHTDRDRTLTLWFFPSGVLKALYDGSLGDARYTGEWRVEGTKVRLINLRGGFFRMVGAAEFDGDVLAGHLREPDEPVTFRDTWRLTENPAEPAVDDPIEMRSAVREDHRSDGK